MQADTSEPRRHPGERRLQLRAGVKREDWGSAGVGAAIPDTAAAFLGDQRLIYLAAQDDGSVWATPLAAEPGFVHAVDERTIRIDAEVGGGDPLGRYLDRGRQVGMLAMEPHTRRRMRVNGSVVAEGRGLTIHTEQVYANCPKYIVAREPIAERDHALPSPPLRSAALSDRQAAAIRRADTFVIGTLAESYGADASHRGGSPGFVQVEGQRISWPEYVGNSMYMTLGNLELDPRCGLLFIDWDDGSTLQVTGRAVVDWSQERAARFPEAVAVVDVDVEMVVEIESRMSLRWSPSVPWPRTPPAAGLTGSSVVA